MLASTSESPPPCKALAASQSPRTVTLAVEKEERERVSAVLPTQPEAIERGREILKNLGGGELIIKSRDGQIRDKVTVGPGKDSGNSGG